MDDLGRTLGWGQRILSRAHHILSEEARAIWQTKEHLSGSFVVSVDALLQANDKVLTMGMGKAGHVARRLSAVLCAGGTPAVYIHPGEAAHGDLGVVSPGDTAVVCSTSGKTREVIEALRLGKSLGIEFVIAVTAHPDAQVGRMADVVIPMGEVEEAGPLGMVPSSSTAAMSALCDALALCVMAEKEFTREDFGRRHHGGYLGEVARGDREADG